MAIFLLIYIIICLIWFLWAGILTYLLLRYRYPDNMGPIHLVIFWIVSIIIFVISAIFISRGDWTTVPTFLKGAGM
jgi:putative copper export protein